MPPRRLALTARPMRAEPGALVLCPFSCLQRPVSLPVSCRLPTAGRSRASEQAADCADTRIPSAIGGGVRAAPPSILVGDLPAGSRIVEADVARQMAISRSPSARRSDGSSRRRW